MLVSKVAVTEVAGVPDRRGRPAALMEGAGHKVDDSVRFTTTGTRYTMRPGKIERNSPDNNGMLRISFAS